MLARLLRDFAAAPILPFDAAAAATFDELASRRLRMGTMDLRIAAIAVRAPHSCIAYGERSERVGALERGFFFSHTLVDNRRFPTHPSSGERPCPSANPANAE